MEIFLRQIKLSSKFSLTLPINGNELVNKLSNLTIPETTLIEVIGNSGKLFVGQVNLTDLSIRPKRTFGQRNFIYSTKLIARLNSTASSVKIEGEIQLTKFHPLMMLSSMAIYFIIVAVSFVQDNAFGTIGLLVQAIFMLGVFYFVFRNAIKTSKEYFEKELYFLTNNSH